MIAAVPGRRRGSASAIRAAGPSGNASLSAHEGGGTAWFFSAISRPTATGEPRSLATASSITDTGWRIAKPARATCWPARPSASDRTTAKTGAQRRHAGRRHERQRQDQRGEHREGVEEDTAVGIRIKPRRIQGDADAAVED